MKIFAHRGTRQWTVGSFVALGWLVIVGAAFYGQYPAIADRVIGTILIALFGGAFMLAAPIGWALPPRLRLVPSLGLLALSFVLFPWLGFGVCSVWTYVGVIAAITFGRIARVVPFVVLLAAVATWFEYLDGTRGGALYSLPLILISVSLMMAAFGRQIRTVTELRTAQHELARLAVEQERSRVGRDLHDILGHSLTVVAIKAELAGRLVDTDPQRAKREISELEDLARGALADVRSTAAGYRGVSVASELANARSALEAAGIRATLPRAADDVPADTRELFGWVVREAVTNVVRHSGARTATIVLAPDRVEVIDDGSGPAGPVGDGSGLTGLRERVEAAGGRMTVGRTPTGGFRLAVSVTR